MKILRLKIKNTLTQINDKSKLIIKHPSPSGRGVGVRAIYLCLFVIGLLGFGVSFADKMLHKHHMTQKSTQEAKEKMVKCPVTGTRIDPAKAYANTVYKGKTYYFCCAGCPEQFKKNPEKYIKK